MCKICQHSVLSSSKLNCGHFHRKGLNNEMTDLLDLVAIAKEGEQTTYFGNYVFCQY